MWYSITDSLLKSHLVEAAYYLKKQRTSLKHEELIGWKPPPSEFIKVNVDGSAEGLPGMPAADGACRDSAGQWLFGFTQQLGEGHAIRAEFFAILKGMELAWNKGYKKVVFETDSLLAIQTLINSMVGSSTLSSLIKGSQNFVKQDWTCMCRGAYLLTGRNLTKI
ncbi:hypothetical protein SLA2020_213810 [Shorea laevis]